MWFLDIKCTAFFLSCMLNMHQHQPAYPAEFKTLQECRIAAVPVARRWKEGNAQYSFNCATAVFRRG